MQGIPQGQPNSGSQGSSKPTLSWQSPAPAVKPAESKQPPTNLPKQNKPKENGEKSNMATYVGIFVAGLIVGILLGWGITNSRSTGTTAISTSTGTNTSPTASTNTPSTGTSLAPGTVEVSGSQAAGASVAVSKINVTKPTWVVVYDNNNGMPGRALGATLFLPTAAGGETSGTISLLRPTIAGTTYLVGQVVDDGDYNLSFSKDSAVIDSNGKPIVIVLTAK